MRNTSTFSESVYNTLSLHMTGDQHLNTTQSILDILDGSSIGSLTIDMQDWHYIEFSDKWARLLDMDGMDHKEQLHHTIQAVHPDDRERVRRFFHETVKLGTRSDSIEYRLVLDTKQIIWVMTKGRLIYENGEPAKFFASCFDITSRKEYEQELQLKSRLISDFFTNISHEFRTPLAIMLMDLDLMDIHLKQADCQHKDRINRNVSVMRQNTYRLFRLISNLLDVTAVNAGAMSCHVSNGDVVESARLIAEASASFAARKHIGVTFLSDEPSCVLSLDHEKYERVLLNLVSNAIKYTKPGGTIKMSMAIRPEHFIVNVQDNGSGIPEDKKANIFDMFRQVNTSLTRDNEGVGIGLALSKGLVELMGGKIWFTSKLGEGSTFSLRLPANAPANHAGGGTERTPLDKRINMEFSDLFSN